MKKILFVLLLAGCSTASVVNREIDETIPPDVVTNDTGDASVNITVETGNPINPDGSTPPDAGNGETDNGCGGPNAPKCGEGKNCLLDRDCAVACSHDHVCVSAPSCKVHFGGDTCGKGEVDSVGAIHESCCKALEVKGFADSSQAGKKVYLDKYEITAGRVRAFIADVTQRQGGKPDVKAWVASNKPTTWNDAWSVYLPTTLEGDSITIGRLLLGDPRHDGETNPGPGVIVPPATDQVVQLGLNYQFSGTVYADVHGNNCGTYPGSYGFPTYWYPDAVAISNGEVPRTLSQEVLDTKSMNCITNAMLAAFCAWDGGQLATNEVINFVTGSPVDRHDSVSGCGTQYDNHGDLLGNYFGRTVQTGGKCPNVDVINATFDAGDNLPFPYPASILNKHNYSFPYMNVNSDKVWQIAAPGRMEVDNVDGWMDLAGNLSEAVLNVQTGRFSLKGRGIGYGSARSDLNVTLMPGETVLRVQRPEVKSALSGGRCMRFSK